MAEKNGIKIHRQKTKAQYRVYYTRIKKTDKVYGVNEITLLSALYPSALEILMRFNMVLRAQ